MKIINPLKTLFSWAIKYFWNLFSVIGVFATFYLGLFYVPDYVKEMTTGKINIIHESLMGDIQEILFYEKELSIEDVQSFIKSKELKLSVIYPYTPVEVLLQVQERFITNKFIPIEQREKLLKKISDLNKTFTPPSIPPKNKFSFLYLLPWFLSGIGLGFTTLGVVSIMRKLKIDQETEADVSSTEYYESSAAYGISTLSSIKFEQMVGEILEELNVIDQSCQPQNEHSYDFLAKKGNKEFIVEVKKFTKLLGVGTARDFLCKVNKFQRNGVLIVSSGVTDRTRQLFDEHNKTTDYQKVYLVMGESKASIKEQLEKIL